MPWVPIELSEDDYREARQSFKKSRFLVDENVPDGVADTLSDLGYNVKKVEDAGLRGHPDENVLGLAHREDRVLLTQDLDFLSDRSFPPHRNPGIILLPGAGGKHGALADGLILMWIVYADLREDLRQAKVVIRSDWVVSFTKRSDTGSAMETTYLRFHRDNHPTEAWVDDEAPPPEAS